MKIFNKVAICFITAQIVFNIYIYFFSSVYADQSGGELRMKYGTYTIAGKTYICYHCCEDGDSLQCDTESMHVFDD